MERAAEVARRLGVGARGLGSITNGAPDSQRYFLLMAGAGLGRRYRFHLNRRVKEAFGKVAYWIGGFSKLGSRFPEFTVQADGREFRASFALLSRVRNYGGDLEIAPTISLLDDEFEMVLFEGESSLGFLKYMLGRGGAPAKEHARNYYLADAAGGLSGRGGWGWTDTSAGGW